MGSEAGLRSTLKKKIKGVSHYVRIENTCDSGTPDVNFAWKSVDYCNKECEIWMELKYLDVFPRKKTTKVTLSCFTKDQIKWLLSRWSVKRGGSWLFVQVGNEYYLFNALDAAKVYYGVNVNEFKDLAQWIGHKGWIGHDLLSVMEISL